MTNKSTTFQLQVALLLTGLCLTR